jgi:hypothetical protein
MPQKVMEQPRIAAPELKPLGVTDSQEGVTVGEVLVRLGNRREKEEGTAAPAHGDALKVPNALVEEQYSRVYVRSYKADPEDVDWARCGVVATVANEEAPSVLRRRLEDAGFKELDLTHLGGDRVLVRSVEGVDVMAVFDSTKDFFQLCFSHWVRWENEAIPYRRGAWVRIYGIPLHAWNVLFFKLCVMDCGRFLRPNSYTAAKDRLDFARVLIATQELAVIKKVEQLLVDGSLVEVQIIEEWGFDLGDDACLLQDDVGSKALLVGDDESWDDPEASNHVDMLVDNLATGVPDGNCKLSQGIFAQPQSMQVEEGEGGRASSPFNTVLEPIVLSTASGSNVERVTQKEMLPLDRVPPIVSGPRRSEGKPGPQQAELGPARRKRTSSCPPGSRSGLSGPWSLEWLQDHNLRDAGVVFSAKKRPLQGSGDGGDLHKEAARGPFTKQAGGFLRKSRYSLKRIARLPIKDRREVLQILQKNARRRKTRGVAGRSRTKGSRTTAEGVTSSSSVNNDWKHWIAMHGSDRAAEEDVLEVGNFIGATFKGDKDNMFSVLSRKGCVKRDILGVAQYGDAPKVR